MKVYIGKIIGGRQIVIMTADGQHRGLEMRRDLRDHSLDFAWGYHGAGPSQLALAICADALDNDVRAVRIHQLFKEARIACLAMDRGWMMTDDQVLGAIQVLEEAARGG